jgi:acetyl esterase/lipase
VIRKLLIALGVLAVIGAVIAGILIAAFVVFVDSTQPSKPGKFYDVPSQLPAGPNGTIIRKELVTGFHKGATTFRVLYKSTSYNGTATAVSGLIVVPEGSAPAGGRKVLAYAHGTLGVAPRCAPSLQSGSFMSAVLPGLDQFLAAGIVIAETDYQGLGTPGPSPYLVGVSEANNVLDSVRAARALPAANAGSDFVVYGESQGGHSALFTGALAATVAPELHLLGVMAAEPASNLVELFHASRGTAVGNILTAMTLSSWSRVYNTAKLDDIVTAPARPLVSQIAGLCIQNETQILASAPAALALQLTFLSQPPWEVEPWKTILAENTPSGDVAAPLFIAQGLKDIVVAPPVQAKFVQDLCARGISLDYRTYPKAGHLNLHTIAGADITAWIAERFAGAPAINSCV